MSEKKFKVVTLGCRTNQYESEAYASQLRTLGWKEAGPEEVADLCIVNSCTVTQSADSNSRREIRKLARKNPGAELVITGCLAERAPDQILSIEGVTRVVPNQKKEELINIVLPDQEIPEFAIEKFGSHTRAFVKVQDGCNSYCTYCIIPYVRGRSRSRTIEEIVTEVRQLIANGYQEVVLTGINIGDFDGGTPETPRKLADLVRAVDQVEGLKRLRISSIDPDEIDEVLMEAVLMGKNTCHSMHVVLQSGSNAILKKMNRKYTRQIFLETIHRLRRAHSDFTFTTDVIVGFPGETEADFQETLNVMEEVQFAKVHLFPYSARNRTRAALFPGQHPPELIRERQQIALRRAEQIAFSLRQQYVGRTMEVLLEEDGCFGHTSNFLPVTFSSPIGTANTFVTVCFKENFPEGLCG